jgi:hypothetical protein
MKPIRATGLLALVLPLAACESPAPTELDASVRAILSGPLLVGEVEDFQGTFAEQIAVDGGTEGAEYVFVLSNTSTAGGQSVSLTVEGEGILEGPVTAAAPGREKPRLGRGPDGTELRIPDDAGFHHDLRKREERLVDELVGRLPDGGRSLLIEAAPVPQVVPEVGDIVELNVNAFAACQDPIFREGRVEAVSNQAIVVADLENPDALTQADFEQIAQNYDEKVFPLSSANFGEPARGIGPPRTTIFYTVAVNELTSDFGGLIGGFFFARDLFPQTERDGFAGCPASNEREMFYALTADPDGDHGQEIPADFIRRTTLTTIMHEHQHLVNASRRLYVLGTGNFEALWLNEALSHIAEELLFYQESGLSPGLNLGLSDVTATDPIRDAVNAHQVANLVRYMLYLDDPPAHSPVDPDDGLEVRGASWSFLRYLADQHVEDDQEFFRSLVNTSLRGAENLGNRLGMSLSGPLARWNVSNFADDLVPGLASVHRQPSWNFRSLLPALTDDESFPLTVSRLQPGVLTPVSVRGGSAAFLRVEVPAGQRGALTTRSGGNAPPETVRALLVRIR